MMWNSIKNLPKYCDFVWVHRPSGVCLAYFNGSSFQESETVGDMEGLSVEYHNDVDYWMDVEKPDFMVK